MLEANGLLIWYPDSSRVKTNMVYKISFSPGSRDVTSLVTIPTKNFGLSELKNFCYHLKELEKLSERGLLDPWGSGYHIKSPFACYMFVHTNSNFDT